MCSAVDVNTNFTHDVNGEVLCEKDKNADENHVLTNTMRFVVQQYDTVPTMDSDKELSRTFRIDMTDVTSKDPRTLGTPGPEVSTYDRPPSDDTGIPDDTMYSTDFTDVLKRGRSFATRQKRRLVNKDGELNIVKGVSSKRRLFCMDIFPTLLDIKWRFIVLLFIAGFVITWLFFAVIWWLLAVVARKDNSQPCVANVFNFASAVLFSIETQHTIGYGYRFIEESCYGGYIVLMLQSCCGVFISAFLAGVVFMKGSRPKRRARTIVFSQNAVICQRDGEFCLLFRVGDMRKSPIVGASIRAVMVRNRLTKENETIPLCSLPIKVEAETMVPDDNFVFLAWPVTVRHKIDESSPLWDVSAEDLIQEQFEIVVVLEGCIESTGMLVQLRTSYLPSEILWGHHLQPLVTYQKENGTYRIDYSLFHDTHPVDMPEKSAKIMSEQRPNDTFSGDEKGKSYPINFTAPTDGARRTHKRTWSLRKESGIRQSLKKSLMAKGRSGSTQTVVLPATTEGVGGHAVSTTSLHNISEHDSGKGHDKSSPDTASTSGLGSSNDLS